MTLQFQYTRSELRAANRLQPGLGTMSLVVFAVLFAAVGAMTVVAGLADWQAHPSRVPGDPWPTGWLRVLRWSAYLLPIAAGLISGVRGTVPRGIRYIDLTSWPKTGSSRARLWLFASLVFLTVAKTLFPTFNHDELPPLSGVERARQNASTAVMTGGFVALACLGCAVTLRANSDPRPAGCPITVQIGEEQIRFYRDGVCRHLNRDRFTKAIETDDSFIIYIWPRLAGVMPKRVFATDEDRIAFRDYLLRSLFPLPPGGGFPVVVSGNQGSDGDRPGSSGVPSDPAW